MSDLHSTLNDLDYGFMAAGGAVLMASVVRWAWHGRRDPLRGSPLRANVLTGPLVAACVAVHLAGLLIGSQVGLWTAPAGLQGQALETWQGLVGTNLTQVLLVVTCLWVGRVAFKAGWRGFGIGRASPGVEAVHSVTGLLAALCLCGLVLPTTQWVVYRFWPTFEQPDHAVFHMLSDPSVPWGMRAFAIGGAFVLAPAGEELFFRGILQTGMRKLLPPRWGSLRHRWVAISLTAALFGLMHGGTPHHVPALIALGLVLGYLYERYGSLLMPFVVHMLFNGKSLLWYYLA